MLKCCVVLELCAKDSHLKWEIEAGKEIKPAVYLSEGWWFDSHLWLYVEMSERCLKMLKYGLLLANLLR